MISVLSKVMKIFALPELAELVSRYIKLSPIRVSQLPPKFPVCELLFVV